MARMKVLCAQRHENIVAVYATATAEDGRGLGAMELLSGGTLADRLRDTPALTSSELGLIVGQALEGLAMLHRRDVVHGDVEPGNIFITNEGVRSRVKLIGIGHGRAGARAGLEDIDEDDPGYVRSLRFASPEQARGDRDIDVRTDVFSMGMVLLEATTGALPDLGRTPREIRGALDRPASLDLSSRLSDLPSDLRHVIQRALNRDRDQRFPSAREMKDALIEALLLVSEEFKRRPLPRVGGGPGSAAIPSGQRDPALEGKPTFDLYGDGPELIVAVIDGGEVVAAEGGDELPVEPAARVEEQTQELDEREMIEVLDDVKPPAPPAPPTPAAEADQELPEPPEPPAPDVEADEEQPEPPAPNIEADEEQPEPPAPDVEADEAPPELDVEVDGETPSPGAPFDEEEPTDSPVSTEVLSDGTSGTRWRLAVGVAICAAVVIGCVYFLWDRGVSTVDDEPGVAGREPPMPLVPTPQSSGDAAPSKNEDRADDGSAPLSGDADQVRDAGERDDSAAPSSNIVVTLRGAPDGAEVQIDGTTVSGPVLHVPADGQEHTIVVLHRGKRRVHRTIRPGDGPRLVIDLRGAPEASDVRRGQGPQPVKQPDRIPPVVRDPGF